ncbi:hypothetical protein THIOKS190133 [Thiocapsa sp. KS1]|nr:hypothetical protein THIOKS190133 [Thiocapsa sp. KS1]
MPRPSIRDLADHCEFRYRNDPRCRYPPRRWSRARVRLSEGQVIFERAVLTSHDQATESREHPPPTFVSDESPNEPSFFTLAVAGVRACDNAQPH